jgi:hypothetical protein
MLKQFGVFHKVGEQHFFATVHEAVDAYVETSNATTSAGS